MPGDIKRVKREERRLAEVCSRGKRGEFIKDRVNPYLLRAVLATQSNSQVNRRCVPKLGVGMRACNRYKSHGVAHVWHTRCQPMFSPCPRLYPHCIFVYLLVYTSSGMTRLAPNHNTSGDTLCSRNTRRVNRLFMSPQYVRRGIARHCSADVEGRD